ncbi:MAG: ABC transporter permease [Alphaproteobacteria bacterium]|nr:ABC transporter permease [Alphaproteobacteria bacterium]
MNIGRMAWRNVWRNPRRSGVTIAAMAFALWVMVLYAGLVDGMLIGMQKDVLDLEVGEIQIHATGYRDDPSIYSQVPDSAKVVKTLEDAGFRASARLTAGGLGASSTTSAGVLLTGLDPAHDGRVSELGERVQDGSWVDPARPDGVVIGRRLAKSLGIRLGDELLVLSQGADGSVANGLFTVTGVLGVVGDGIDRTGVFMNEGAFRDLMAVPTGAHQITLRTPPGLQLAEAKAKVMDLVPDTEVETWRELLPTVATMLDSTRGLITVVFFIVYVAIAILVLNAMLMAVFERIREFGVMKAIGVGPGAVLGMITLETLFQTLIAMAIGLTAAAPVAAYLAKVGVDVGVLGGTSMLGVSMQQRWTGVYGPGTVIGPVVALAIMVTLAVLYPAAKAAWIRPLDAMRYR